MKQEWQIAEAKDSKLFRSKRQRGSGNQDHHPTDSYSDTYAIETKFTTKESYSINLDKWIKLENECAVLNQKDNKLRVPLISLHLQNKHLIVLSYEDFKYLEEKAWKYDDLST